MSRKMIIKPTVVLEDGYMGGSDPVYSEVTTPDRIDRIEYQFKWTGNPTGTFFVQSSLDYNPPLVSADDATWDDLDLPSTPTAVGEAGHGTIDITETASAYLRAGYDPSSGTGSLTIRVGGKES